LFYTSLAKFKNKSFFTQRFYTYIGTCENRGKLNYMYNMPRVIKIKRNILIQFFKKLRPI